MNLQTQVKVILAFKPVFKSNNVMVQAALINLDQAADIVDLVGCFADFSDFLNNNFFVSLFVKTLDNNAPFFAKPNDRILLFFLRFFFFNLLTFWLNTFQIIKYPLVVIRFFLVNLVFLIVLIERMNIITSGRFLKVAIPHLLLLGTIIKECDDSILASTAQLRVLNANV